jgi:hypothetical protein
MQDACIPLSVFIADEITVPAGFGPAASRLLHVINKGALHHASTAAYEEGLTARACPAHTGRHSAGPEPCLTGP